MTNMLRGVAIQATIDGSCVLVAAAVALTCLTGCGESGLPNMVPIRGTVTYQGRPLQEGTVLYVPKASDGRQARGDIQPDGSFRLTTLRKYDGAQHGDYAIVVIALEPHPGEPPSREEVEAAGGIKRGSIIPAKYTKPDTSGLSDTVDGDHSGMMEIKLAG
jgi:hypothetical protein